MPGERTLGQDHPYYDWSPIVKRPPLRWPNNARVALAVIVNLEHWDWQLPADEPAAPAGPFRPDLAGYSQHEYGNRVGVFRIFKILDKYGIKPTIAMDRTVAENYPFLVKEVQAAKSGSDRPWRICQTGNSLQNAGRYRARIYTGVHCGRDQGHWKAADRLAKPRVPGIDEHAKSPRR